MNLPTTATELLQALVRIPSVNPEGNPGTEPANVGEKACAEYVGEFLKASGANVEFSEVLPGRPNVIGRWPTGGKDYPPLIFAPHTDTVSVAGMKIDPFGGELRDGKIWGRGASDTKGPMAAMLWALHTMKDWLPRLHHEIIFVGLAGEEAGQHGARAFVAAHGEEMKRRGAFAVIGEPTSLDTVVAHKGPLWLTLTTRGRAVHAAEPHRGDNAIYKMVDLLRYLRDELPLELAKTKHPLLGSPSISVGMINGGSKTNIVPDLCRVEVDMRILPGDTDTLERITAKLRSICPGVEIEHSSSQSMLTDEAHPVIQYLKSSGSRCVGAPWFSDAAIFAQAGIPAIAIGPGSIAQAHTEDEWIATSELDRGAAFFSRFLAIMGK